jgi:peptidylprolyl isomerase
LAAALATTSERDTSKPTPRPTLPPLAEEPTQTAPPVAQEPTQSAPPAPGAITTASGLQYIEVKAGDGPAPQAGDLVSVHYTGSLEDGTVFDSSRERGEPIQFALGTGMVIPGWDEGIGMMQEGGQAMLIIPPDLAYGEFGSGDVIPPNATLIFEVELVSVSPGAPDSPTAVNEGDYVVTGSGLKYYDLEVGAGPTPQVGEAVLLQYTGWLGDGTMFDSSLDHGQLLGFALGTGQMIPGLDEGVANMQVGGKRQVVIPPELAYGEQGAGSVIPPNATLIFELELISITPGSPDSPTEVSESDYVVTDSGLKYYDIQVGDGPAPQVGQLVLVHYTAWLEDGLKFDSSLDRGQTLSFPVGMGQMMPGFDEGVATMQVGGKRQLVIPPELAYGEQGAGEIIPPNATLIFEVELVSVE